MGRHMTLELTFVEYLSKVNIVEEFDALTKEEVNKIIREEVKKLVLELYNLNIKKVAYLSERDTYVIRKMYGVLDDGECQTGADLRKYAGVTNIAAIKMRYFQKMNEGIKAYIINYNFKKKKEMVLNRLGLKDSKYLHLNACIGLYEDSIWEDEYYFKYTIDEIIEKIKDYKVFITCAADFDNIVLKNRGDEVLKLHFGLDGRKEKTLKEIGEIFNVTRERVRQIESESIAKIRRDFNFGDGAQDLCGTIKAQYFLRITRRILTNLKISTIEELTSIPEEELIIKLENAVICDLEKSLKEKNSKIIDEKSKYRINRKMVLTRVLTVLNDINRVRKIDYNKAKANLERYVKTLKA